MPTQNPGESDAAFATRLRLWQSQQGVNAPIGSFNIAQEPVAPIVRPSEFGGDGILSPSSPAAPPVAPASATPDPMLHVASPGTIAQAERPPPAPPLPDAAAVSIGVDPELANRQVPIDAGGGGFSSVSVGANGVTINVPGVGQQTISSLDRHVIGSRIRAAMGRWHGQNTVGDAGWAIEPSEGVRVLRELEALASPAASGGPTGPLNTTTQQFSMTQDGPVSAAHAQAGVSAAEAKKRALEAFQEDQRRRADVAAQAATALGEEATELAQVQAEAEEARQAEIATRLADLDTAIEEAGSMRTDPGRVFGSGAGRALAGLSIVLGNIFRTGDTNQALATVQAMVDRDLAAQAQDQANVRAAVGQQANAMAHFRNLTQDDRAAEAAVRSARYGALHSRLTAMMAHMRPDQLAFAQELQNRFAEERAANQAIARDQANGRLQTTVKTRIRRRGGNAAGAAARGLRAASAADDAAQARQEEVGDLQAQIAEDVAAGRSPREQLVERLRALQTPEPEGRTRTRRRVGSARRQRRPRVPGLTDQAGFHEEVEAAEEQAGTTTSLPGGLVFLRDSSLAGDPAAIYQANTQSPEERREVRQLSTNAEILQTGVSEILRIREEFGSETFTLNDARARAEAWATRIRDRYRRDTTGAAANQQEMDNLGMSFPDPSEFSSITSLASFDSVASRWRAQLNVGLREIRARLRPFAVTTASDAAAAERAAGRNQRLARTGG